MQRSVVLVLSCLGATVAYDLSIASPKACQVEGSDSILVDMKLENVEPNLPAGLKHVLSINGHHIDMPFHSMAATVPQLPFGGHVFKSLVLDQNNNTVRSTPSVVVVLFDPAKPPPNDDEIGSKFQSVGARNEELELWLDAAEAYKCSTTKIRLLDPYLRLAHVLNAGGVYQDAVNAYHFVRRHIPNDPGMAMASALAEYFLDREKCGAKKGVLEGCDSPCCEAADDKVLQRFREVMDLGLETVDAHHYTWEELALSVYAESDLSVYVKWLWLKAECAMLRSRRPQHPMQPPVPAGTNLKERGPQRVVIYARQYLDELTEPWGPSSVKQGGIGGANEAAVFMSRELVALGYSVEVYGNPSIIDIGLHEDGTYWYPYWVYDDESTPDVFVAWWHHLDSLWMGRNAKLRYVWVHYAQYHERYTPGIVAMLDGVFPLSKFHGAQLPPFAQSKVFVSANGIDPSMYVDGPNTRQEFIYASHPFYGLETLLKAWPEIKKRLPEATLDVYYGFTPGVRRYLKANGKRGQDFLENMERMLSYDGIRYHGMVGAKDLAIAIAGSGFYLYPCEISEISSISLMRAQALGSIPITSRYIESALPETSQYDLGPPAHPGLIGQNPQWLKEWIDAIVDAATDDSGRVERHRQEMKAWARDKFQWSKVALQWDGWFREHLAPKL